MTPETLKIELIGTPRDGGISWEADYDGIESWDVFLQGAAVMVHFVLEASGIDDTKGTAWVLSHFLEHLRRISPEPKTPSLEVVE